MSLDPSPALAVTVLKNVRYGTRPDGHLPYRIDQLEQHEIRLRATDLPYRRIARRLPDHMLQTAILAPSIARSDVVLAMFESSAHPFGYLRHLVPPTRTVPLAVMSCWLPEVLAAAEPRRLDRYRAAYRHVDHLFCFSQNQCGLLAHTLGLDPARVSALTFGVDADEFVPGPDARAGHLLAVGRDRGRDWKTLFAALASVGTPTRVICRPHDIAGLQVPDNVEVLGPIDRTAYRRELADARAVLVITHVLGYPTGQSVLLEAMSSGKACIVTESPAMADYVDPGRTALVTPPHDVGALAELLDALRRDEAPLDAIGRAARAEVVGRLNSSAMWATVATRLHSLAATARERG